MDTIETYTSVVLSTAHLTQDDAELIDSISLEGNEMIFARDAQLFIKLYGGAPALNVRGDYSETLKNIIKWAIGEGYLLIEFDADALYYDLFPTFDW